jgi:Preprotein translocase subunit SecB
MRADVVTASTVVDEESYPAIRLVRAYMIYARFADLFAAEASSGGEFLVDLGLTRVSELELSVALTVRTSEDSPYELTVTYAADFVMVDEVPAETREEIWRNTAYELAPSLLYPYIREAFASVTGRSRLGTEALPFLPLPLETPEEEQAIPPAPVAIAPPPAGWPSPPEQQVGEKPRGKRSRGGR